MTHHDSTPPAAAPHKGRRLAAALAGSAAALLVAAGLWLAAGYRATNECRETGFGIADAVEMTEDGCQLIVRSEDGRRLRSAPMPSHDGALSALSIVAAAAAAIPPYILLLRRRH